MLDSNSFENIVDKKFKFHAYFFFAFNFEKILENFQNMCLCF